LQGFGNVGSFAAMLLHELGGRVLGVTDASGGIWNANGIDVPSLLAYAREKGSVSGFPGGEAMSNEELLASEVDVLIPAALGNVLNARNAQQVRAKYIVEAANNPTEPAADEVFERRNIVIVPDILANAGGVTVSYFEWVQNRQHFRWELARVRKELDRVMTESFGRVWEIAETRKVPLRLAAYLLGIGRVGRATVLGGL
jgi:glutamate dehydrogenase (NAD(P)+)